MRKSILEMLAEAVMLTGWPLEKQLQLVAEYIDGQPVAESKEFHRFLAEKLTEELGDPVFATSGGTFIVQRRTPR